MFQPFRSICDSMSELSVDGDVPIRGLPPSKLVSLEGCIRRSKPEPEAKRKRQDEARDEDSTRKRVRFDLAQIHLVESHEDLCLVQESPPLDSSDPVTDLNRKSGRSSSPQDGITSIDYMGIVQQALLEVDRPLLELSSGLGNRAEVLRNVRRERSVDDTVRIVNHYLYWYAQARADLGREDTVYGRFCREKVLLPMV
ncbi:hypothetical protein HYQ46_010087 [Verticillium longisporum]|uniref:Uncharacterized protein n=1 Tax=Verticillium longisporum TaxID=100787 RepID=A0A0G4LB00_VERLO|nr:hypothetical protein HYQ44_014562 [Verticillium longisporum]KAG7129805.1 hypothetical protein HYQ46_010087 [Verticillium longisporum]CRK18830.1 hypothetical protein BN1708_003175 [Verticillium longisporum]